MGEGIGAEGDGEGGWIPASAGMTGGLAKATYGDENGLAPGTGNHKGCPYGRGTGREDGFLPPQE